MTLKNPSALSRPAPPSQALRADFFTRGAPVRGFWPATTRGAGNVARPSRQRVRDRCHRNLGRPGPPRQRMDRLAPVWRVGRLCRTGLRDGKPAQVCGSTGERSQAMTSWTTTRDRGRQQGVPSWEVQIRCIRDCTSKKSHRAVFPARFGPKRARLGHLSSRLNDLSVRVNDLSTRVNHLTVRLDDLTVRTDEPTERLDHSAVWSDAISVRLDGPTARPDGSAARLNESAVGLKILIPCLCKPAVPPIRKYASFA